MKNQKKIERCCVLFFFPNSIQQKIKMNCTFGIVNHGIFEERYLVTDIFCYYTGQVTSSSAGQSVSPVFFKQVSVIIVRMNENTQGELVDPLSPRSELSLLSSV